MREGQCWQGGSQGGPARVPGSSTFRITMNMMITMMANDNDDEVRRRTMMLNLKVATVTGL